MGPAATGQHVLLADPGSASRRRIEEALRERGYGVGTCDAPERVLALISGRNPPDLLLLGAGPAPERLALLRRLRRVVALPIVLVAHGKAGEADSVPALESGADDYLAAGMPVAEMLARIGAVLRRAAGQPRPGAASGSAAPRCIEGGWRLAASRRALVAASGEASIPLTGAEFELLRLLEQAGGEPVDRETISRLVFRRAWSATDRAVDGLVKRLRRKLQAEAIASVRGVGYALCFDEARQDGANTAEPLHSEVEICAHTPVVSSTGMQSAVVEHQAQH
ncbi:winged helix-turn-helix domain-containing protein [Falsiroseomonas sp. HW251]|uniref:winged helix-turn-helix domain-containing protein n=1 Tax=Falsiroseomonas sp. HW251 TaxID=3390998 RepID=UPI003D311CF8